MKNILVTGGAGFIGSHLVDRLLSEGQWKVSVIDDLNDFYDPAIKLANASKHEKNSNYQLFKTDIRDQRALKKFSQLTASIALFTWQRARAFDLRSINLCSMLKQTSTAP